MLWTQFLVKKHQRGLLLRDGDFQQILDPGQYRYFDPAKAYSLELYSVDSGRFDHPLVNYLRQQQPELVAQQFHVIDLTDAQVGLRFEHQTLVEILPPGFRGLYWQAGPAQQWQILDLPEDAELSSELLARLGEPGLRSQPIAGLNGILKVQVPAWHQGLLRHDGQTPRLLSPGRYGFWRFHRELSVELVDTRWQTLEISGQEILTRDKVSLRLNLSVTWQLTDVLAAYSQLNKPAEHLYRELQLALRAAVGTKTLDELLDNKQHLDDQLLTVARNRLTGFGIALQSLGVKDIILPGDMKALLAKVVEADKAAQANLIRRREETGATRSLLNTAKVMEDNPTALRLKELETLEKLAERIDRISVFGGLDQLLNGLVQIRNH